VESSNISDSHSGGGWFESRQDPAIVTKVPKVSLQSLNKESVLYASEEVGPEVNEEKIKYTLKSRHQNAEQTHNKGQLRNNLKKLTNFRIEETNKDRFTKELNRILNSVNVC
jgi:hypothetical protein